MTVLEILKYKEKGLKLYDILRNVEVTFNTIDNSVIYCDYKKVVFSYFENGAIKDYPNGLQILKPSKNMQDWDKFAWKPGDVVYNQEGTLAMFDGWSKDDFTEFNSLYSITDNQGNLEIDEDRIFCTSDFIKADDEQKKDFIKSLEKEYGGKFNSETLEIEECTKFKDGDIVIIHNKNYDRVFIFNRMKTEDSFYFYAFYTLTTKYIGIMNEGIKLPYEWTYIDGKIHLATDSEKQQLFDALAKQGKKWNPETKTFEDLSKKYEFKPFDKVLVRDNNIKWGPAFFAIYNISSDCEYPYGIISNNGYAYYQQCIPYNDKTKHLLGTTDEWKGGEEC